IFQSQATSLVMEGAFDRFPDLRVVFIESGFTWLPSLMWRMDKEWKGLRHNTPWVKRAPSHYWKEHLRLTIQPVDGPPNASHLRQIVEQIGSDEMLLYGSDYPHLHESENALFATLSVALEKKIRSENARTFYRL
ncbi:MAG: amidohydrolase, partial [Chloroflexi bacterium]